MGSRRSLDQARRLGVAVSYVGALLLLSLYLNGGLLPPFGLEGLWFYAAFAALILGELLIEPFFTRPADALANATALLIAVATVSLTTADVAEATARSGRLGLLLYGLLVIGLASTAVVLKDSTGHAASIAAGATALVGRLGRARWMFSVLLFAAGYAAFADDGERLAILYLAWLTVIVLQPLESAAIWVNGRRGSREHLVTGRIERVEDPGIFVVRLPRGSRPALGRKAYMGDARLEATVVDVTTSLEDPVVRLAPADPVVVPVGTTVEVTDAASDEPVVGHVGAGTSLEELVVDASPSVAELGITEGRLIAAGISGADALYQVTGAAVISARDAEIQRDLVRVTARKLGMWNEIHTSFDPVPWVPLPGAPVRLMARAEEHVFVPERIGHVPGTAYGISIDLDYAVTHNTAILGILGIGKTHLAWELLQRMLVEGIKVVVLDITGRYSRHLADICSRETEDAIAGRITSRIAANVDNRTVRDDEAGNAAEFREVVAETLRDFYEGSQQLLILNPNRFEVSRMEGKPFSGEANMLVRLTMVEVTRIIADHLLEIVQGTDQPPASDNEGKPEQAKLCLVLEEGHSLVPEWSSAANDAERMAVNGTARAILQGRKYGFGCLLITQRTANVTKSILNQCNTVFGLRIYDATGMGFLENYIGPAHASLLASLRDRHAVVFGRASSCNAPIIVELNDASDFRTQYWDFHRDEISVTTPPTDSPEDTEQNGFF